MNFGVPLLGSDDDYRYCYVRTSLLRKAQSDPRILDALLDQLQVPGKSLADLKRLSSEEKLEQIEKQIDHYRGMPTSVWHGVPAPEVFAASILRSQLPQKIKNEFFSDVRKESDLLSPVSTWLAAEGYSAYAEIPLGLKRVDVLGHKKGFLSGDRIVAIELKNEKAQFERALDQMTTFREYAHIAYLACTPRMAADYLDRHSLARGVKHWDPTVFSKKLKSFGIGLLLVEGRKVWQVLSPDERVPRTDKMKEALNALQTKVIA